MTDKVHNPDRWNHSTDPVAAARSAAEAKARGLPQWQHEMTSVVDDQLVRSLVSDGRSFARARSDFVKPVDVGRTPQAPLEPVKLGPYSGQSIIDRMCEAQARRD